MKRLCIGLNDRRQELYSTPGIGDRVDYNAVAYVYAGTLRIEDSYNEQVLLSASEARNLLKLLKAVLLPKKGKK